MVLGDGDVIFSRGVVGDRNPDMVDGARLKDDRLGVWFRFCTGCGKPEYLFSFEGGGLEITLPVALLLLLGIFGRPPADMTTDDAGELPGVPMALWVAGLSRVTMLDTESRMW